MREQQEERNRDRRVALLLVGAFFLFFLLFYRGHFSGTDEVGVYEATRSLWEGRSFSVPQGDFVHEGHDGRLYNHFAVGQSILALPFYGLGKAARAVLPASWLEALAGKWIQRETVVWGGSIEIFAVGLYAPLAAAVLVGIFFFFQRQLGVSLRCAVISSALLGATSYVAMMSTYFLRHSSEAITVLGALCAFHAYRRGGSIRILALGSLLASFTILIRVPAAMAGAGLAGYLAFILVERLRTAPGRERARALTAIALPFIAVASVHMAVNLWKWGSLLSSPMVDQADRFGGDFMTAALGFLVSPACSIFAYTPLLLLIPWILPAFWRQHRAECAACVSIVFTFFVVCSKFELWTGLYSSPGPRYLFLATPLLLLGLGCWLDQYRGRAGWWAIAVLSAVGLAVQLPLMLAKWGVVVVIFRYRDYVPAYSFVFTPERSPIWGSAIATAHGSIDSWIFKIGRGWPDHAGSLTAALLLATGCCVLLGICLVRLRHELRASTAPAA